MSWGGLRVGNGVVTPLSSSHLNGDHMFGMKSNLKQTAEEEESSQTFIQEFLKNAGKKWFDLRDQQFESHYQKVELFLSIE